MSDDDMYDDEPLEESILTVIGDYDRFQRKRIKQLEAKNKFLTEKNNEYLNQSLASAQASSGALLRNILSGAFDNIRPTDSKEQLLSRIGTILKDYEKATNMGTDARIELRERCHSKGDIYIWNGTEFQSDK